MPSNFNYMNQSAPFWDFLASLEQQGSQHPAFSRNVPGDREHENENGERHQGPSTPFDPWGWGHQFFGGPRGMPHRGPPPHHHHEAAGEKNEENEAADDKDAGMSDENDNGEGPAGQSGSDTEGRHRGYGGRCGGRRGRCHGGPRGFGHRHGPPHHGPGPHHGPPPHGPAHDGPGHHRGPPHGRRGPRGPWGRGGPFGGFGGPYGGMFDPTALATQFWSQFTDNQPSTKKENTESEDFTPDADIFDTESAFIVHVSLPGAKKEDVGVNWDVEKSELSVAGVIYRPGDEEFLKTLAMNERKVGPFERKIRLGTRASPAHIDADGISAKLEDGVLRIEVPKMDSGFVEIKKVDIE